MRPILYAHPFSSYSWKVLIALWENGTAFEYRSLADAGNAGEWARAWPLKRFPLLVDGGVTVPEATIIVEYLGLRYPGPAPMLPADPVAALEVRRLDRLADNYLMGPVQTIVFDRRREAADRDEMGVAQARGMLDAAYAWWDAHMAGREWGAAQFGLVECAAGPALFYADWVYPIAERFGALRAYRARILARPSMARAVDEARPFRAFFPFGDPGRD